MAPVDVACTPKPCVASTSELPADPVHEQVAEASNIEVQLMAIKKLLSVYKVEHFALLEQLRLQAWEKQSGGAPPMDPLPMRTVLKKRAREEAESADNQRFRQEAAAGPPKDEDPKTGNPVQQPQPPQSPLRPALGLPQSPVRTGPTNSDSAACMSLQGWMGNASSTNGAPLVMATPQSARRNISPLSGLPEITTDANQTTLSKLFAPAAALPPRGEGTAPNSPEVVAPNPAVKPAVSQPSPSPLKSTIQSALEALNTHGDQVLGFGSDDELYTLDEAGPLLSDRSEGAPAASQTHVTDWQQRFRSHAAQILDLEATASASAAVELDEEGALAALVGASVQYLIKRTTVGIGRGTVSKGEVDVDLAQETIGAPCTNQVSRRQAFLSLGADGAWALCNTGRRRMCVDGTSLAQFDSRTLRHLSLIELGSLRLMFVCNQAAMERVKRRSTRLVL
eukprot:gene32312-16881_t